MFSPCITSLLFFHVDYLLMLDIMVGARDLETAKKRGPYSRGIQFFWEDAA